MKFFNWGFILLLLSMLAFWIMPFILPQGSFITFVLFFVIFGVISACSPAYFSNVDELSRKKGEKLGRLFWFPIVGLVVLGTSVLVSHLTMLSLVLFLLSIALMVLANFARRDELTELRKQTNERGCYET